MNILQNYLIYIILAAAAALSVTSRKLNPVAGITGFIVALFIYKGAGYTGIAMLAAFFIMGSVSTGWRSAKK